MLTAYPYIYQCCYCGSERIGNTLIRSCDFNTPTWACGECKSKNKKKIISKPGWIYMIGHDEWWKVGFTTKAPEYRVKELQIGNPHLLRICGAKMVNDCLVSELFIHRRLKEFHYRGEWFHGPEDKIRSIINFDK